MTKRNEVTGVSIGRGGMNEFAEHAGIERKTLVVDADKATDPIKAVSGAIGQDVVIIHSDPSPTPPPRYIADDGDDLMLRR